MNIIELFLGAGLVVQFVMIFLLFFSILSWAIILQKSKMLASARKESKQFSEQFWKTKQLSQLYSGIKTKQDKGLAHIFKEGFKNFSLLYQHQIEQSKDAIEGAERAMRLTMNKELDGLEQNLSTLGTIGSISPYIGLFGTVWGIMNAFFALGSDEAKQATLQMVAPHIGEALIATAIGLFAAIPAVLAYNRLTQKLKEIEQQYYNFIDEFSSILQRQTLPVVPKG